jgi:hypothetical protein
MTAYIAKFHTHVILLTEHELVFLVLLFFATGLVVNVLRF